MESNKPQTKLYKLSKTKEERCSLKNRIFLKKKRISGEEIIRMYLINRGSKVGLITTHGCCRNTCL